jgi:hypothetical protein
MLVAGALAGLALIARPAQAAVIPIDPGAGVTASSEIPGFDRIDDYIVDGSGLTAGEHGTTPDGSMWLSTGDGFGGVDPDPAVTFDLGALYTIESFQVWNYNEFGGGSDLSSRGVDAVTVEYGTTSALGSTVSGVDSFSQAPASDSYTGEVFDSFEPFNARHIRFDVDSNHGSGASFYGLSEVQFNGTLVPEPASLALMGLGGLMLLPQRRRA